MNMDQRTKEARKLKAQQARLPDINLSKATAAYAIAAEHVAIGDGYRRFAEQSNIIGPVHQSPDAAILTAIRADLLKALFAQDGPLHGGQCDNNALREFSPLGAVIVRALRNEEKTQAYKAANHLLKDAGISWESVERRRVDFRNPSKFKHPSKIFHVTY